MSRVCYVLVDVVDFVRREQRVQILNGEDFDRVLNFQDRDKT